jgi:exonuclease VII small subunit
MQTMELSNEKCRIHGQRYCPEPGCCTSLVAKPVAVPVDVPNGSSIEDSLVGRSTVASTTVLSMSPPLVVHPIGTTTVSTSVPDVQKTESGEHPLVAASTAYAEAIETHHKAVAFLRDCEKRLEFAKGEVAEALQVTNKAFEKVRHLVGEQR